MRTCYKFRARKVCKFDLAYSTLCENLAKTNLHNVKKQQF